MLQYDLYYLKHAGVWLDCAILASAIWQFARRNIVGAVSRPSNSVSFATSNIASNPHRPHRMADQLRTPERAAEPEVALIVGAGAGGELIAGEMLGNRHWGFRPIGFVDDNVSRVGQLVRGLPVLGVTTDIAAIAEREQVDVIVIAVPSASPETRRRFNELARETRARVLTMPDLGSLLRGSEPRALRSIETEEILDRPSIQADIDECRRLVSGRRVMITGAAGSIGSELTRQVARLEPAQVIAVDTNESGLFDLVQDLSMQGLQVDVQPVVVSVTNEQRLVATFSKFHPDIVFHAAAYKHVPLMEQHPDEAVMVNVLGTERVVRLAAAFAVSRFVLVSSDKAVRPSSVMGATKRVAELVVKAVAEETGLSACSVRFGNVLGSRGSVLPTFERQIRAGGPITITDPAMKRFFMTIPDAVGLIVHAGAFGVRHAIYELDMGDEIAIIDLAKRLVRLHGLEVGRDIDIVVTGLRPGEKLREELVGSTEISSPTDHPRINVLSEGTPSTLPLSAVMSAVRRLEDAVWNGDVANIRALLFGLVLAADGQLFDGLETQSVIEASDLFLNASNDFAYGVDVQLPVLESRSAPALPYYDPAVMPIGIHSLGVAVTAD
jgi:FlaA1/EpsC-like NDP-sugar epimerase